MYRIEHHLQPPDDERRHMTPQTAMAIKASIQEGSLVADPERLEALAEEFTLPTRLDGWDSVDALTTSLGSNDELFWSDLDLLRPCLGNEHAAAVFDGNEIDYVPYFYDTPEALQITRLTALAQDSGKALAVAEEGNNFGQTAFNKQITEQIVAPLQNLTPTAKKAISLLVGQDLIGGILQNKDVTDALEEFRAAWPPDLADYRDDLLLASYLSDASAHSGMRLYRNARNSYTEPAVRPDDAQLTFLFEHHPNGAVTLTEDRRQLLLDALPGINRLRPLLTGEPSPIVREDDIFKDIITRKLDRYASVQEGMHEYSDNGEEKRLIRLGTNALHGTNVTIFTTYASRSDVSRQQVYFTPGDGRIWEQSATTYHRIPMFDAYYDGNRDKHPDAAIDKMQSDVAYRRAIEGEDLGKPLSPKKAWQVIEHIGNII